MKQDWHTYQNDDQNEYEIEYENVGMNVCWNVVIAMRKLERLTQHVCLNPLGD